MSLISAFILMLSAIEIGCISTGASKLIQQSKGKNNGGYSSRSKSMAMVLTGRILLCHIISLSLVIIKFNSNIMNYH